jgi:phosphotriesterase-related protein
MAVIPTVQGQVNSSGMGVTLVHEHLCFRASEQWQQEAMDYQVKLLRDAAEVGINTVVELTPVPDVARIIEANERVPDVNVILSTGAYLEDAPWTGAVGDLNEEQMVERMIRNLTEGYDGFEETGVRAGIIKIASATQNITEWEAKNFRAAARVQQQVPVPIAVHSCAGARTQMELLREHGARIEATFYSHVEAEFGWEGRTLDEEARYLEDVARAGGYLQFNNFDFEFDTPFADLLYLVNYLEDHGHGERIFISIDANWEFDETGRPWHEQERQHPEAGKRDYAYCITNAVPMLMRAGVSLQRINRYLVENPRRLFEAFDGD